MNQNMNEKQLAEVTHTLIYAYGLSINKEIVANISDQPLKLVQYYLSLNNEYNLNERTSLLSWAALNGYLDVVEFIVSNMTDLNTGDSRNRSKLNNPFNDACTGGHLDIIKFFLLKGVDIKCVESYSFQTVVEKNYLFIVKYLIDQGFDISKNINNLLSLSSYHGHLNITKYLVEKGANVNAQESKALRESLEYFHIDTIKYLLEQGANIHAKDHEVLQTAVNMGNIPFVLYLYDFYEDQKEADKIIKKTLSERSSAMSVQKHQELILWFEQYFASKQLSEQLNHDLVDKANHIKKIKL